MNDEKRRILLRAIACIAAVLLLLFIGLKVLDRWQKNKYREVRGTGTDEFMQSGTVTWNGGVYKKTPAVTTLLIAGIDKDENAQRGIGTSRYRNGGQADFLLLLAIDSTNRRICQLQIDRDAMTDVTVLSVYGRETGSRVMQICLAHNYGANDEENARYTIRAVRGLMNGLEIDGYYMMDYSAVAAFTDALGGVTVTVPDDMTSVNPLWEKGSVVTLQGREAEQFVRARKAVGQGTNEERMRRQNEYMQQALSQVRARLSKDISFGTTLLNALKKNAVSDWSDQMLLEQIQQSLGYKILPVSYLDGEYRIGESGYMEFYVKEGSAENWIMESLYTKRN